MKFRALFAVLKNGVSLLLVLSFFIDAAGVTLISSLLLKPRVAEAAQVVIQGSPNTTGASHILAGASTVFVSDQVGYKFYRHGAAPSSGTCGYVKTTNGGGLWGSYVVVDTRADCISVSVWYDQWTPGDTGSYIHISTIDTTSDELFYNRLDTTNDTLLLANSVSGALGLAGSFVAGTNDNSITKATDGKIFMVADDSNGTQLRSCASSCDLSASWSTPGTPPQGNNNSFSQLLPLAGGEVMLINRSTTNVMRSSIWNGTSWPGFTTIDGSAVQNTNPYDIGFASTLDIDSGDIYLAYVTDNNDFITQDHDIRTRLYTGGAWSSKTDVLTNVAGRGLLHVGLARNINNGDIYVAYTARATIGTANTANVYWKLSTDNMTSWGTQQGPMDSSSADMYGVDVNIMAEERLYISWYDVTATDIIGDTMADIGPEVRLSATSTQISTVRASTTNFYIGGKFLLEALASRTVSSVVITESGTIDAASDMKNIKLYYENDTSNPYNCASESYAGIGGETQFGSTALTGFSGSDGTASFTASPVSFSSTSALCFYVIADIQSTANDGDTIEISIEDPENDVLVSDGLLVKPFTAIAITGTTTVADPDLTQFGYHWRLDNGTETTASSATSGVENTALTALQIGTPRRLRVGVANQGSTSTLASTYRLEYGIAAPSCEAISTWETVGDTNAEWNLSNSANLTDGSNTTNILVANGGVTDLPSTSFLVSNGGQKDTASSTGSLTLAVNNFIEVEYSIVASTSASQGSTYCFRMTQTGFPLSVYSYYPEATISADVTVASFGTQTVSVDVGTSSAYAGGGFSLIENSSSRDVTSIKVTELGTVDGDTGIKNLELYYDLDVSNPYNCASESYSGSETQYGTTSSNGFSGVGESVTFTDNTVSINTTSALCVYVVYDVDSSAQNGETIELLINSPSVDIGVSGGGSVGPSTPTEITGTTTIQGPILTQLAYHWRNDNGNETGATSATAGAENTALTEFGQNSPIRLRLAVSNSGSVTSSAARYRLEYAPKITTCSAASVWTPVNASSDGWDIFNSSFITNGQDTTNIAVGSGGVSNGSGSFVVSNGGLRDTEDLSATTSLPSTDYLDLEYSITSTNFTSYGTTFCFRVSAGGQSFQSYAEYAEVTTAPKRDFKVQRGSSQVSGTSTTILAGVGYTAPASSSKAFVRITNSHYTGAGNTASTSGQNADDITAYISNPQNIMTSFTISRPALATSNTRVDWEIVEFIGNANTDNEMIVRDARTVSFTTATVVATGTSVSVNSDNKVVVFITGISNENISRNFYAGQVTSEWDANLNVPVFRRGANGASIARVSYAVVEFVGGNWNVQRAQHTYTAATGTVAITAVNSLARTFIHAQKRMGASTNVVQYGHEVWLSSIGALSFQLEAGATIGVGHTSVVWVIENTQTSTGAMKVQRSAGSTTGGTGPLSLSITLSTPLTATNNTSITATTRAPDVSTTYPRPNAGFTITSTSTYQIWRSNTGSLLTYRVELVEWPVADLTIRQSYYKFFADNNAILPDDPWPVGPTDLGESTSITVANEPLGNGDLVRVRVALRTLNANMPAGLVNFKLQYALRSTTCTALGELSWNDVGAAGSGAVWRGYGATGTTDGTVLSTDPPTGGDLIISYSNRAGTLEHENPSEVNPYPVLDGDYLEYDWYLQHNGAIPLNTYCFRTVRSDGTPLDGYDSNYPQIRTAGFSPVVKNWRWYSDETIETPIVPLANETVAPIDIANTDTLALRVTVREKRNVQGDNIKFKLQFSDDISFNNPVDVAATSTCNDLSLWCYTPGGVPDNTLINNNLLTDAESCIAGVGNGCGRHNSSPDTFAGHTHGASRVQEYSFTIRHAAARVNAVYYFRLYDITNESPVSLDTGESYASLVTEGSDLQITLSGLPNGTTTAGVVTDVSTTPNSIGFGNMAFNTEYIGAHRLNVITNATEGYQILSFARQQLLGPSGIAIPSVTATNTTPLSWSAGCLASSTGCVGYHTTDATLQGGSTRFGPTDTYAGLETSPVEVMYSSIPATDTHDIVYRIRVNEKQPAGDYETEIVYLAVPSY